MVFLDALTNTYNWSIKRVMTENPRVSRHAVQTFIDTKRLPNIR